MLHTVTLWTDQRACQNRELELLIGLLQHACRIVQAGRSFLRCIIDLLHIPRCPHHHVRLNRASEQTCSGGCPLLHNGTAWHSCHHHPQSPVSCPWMHLVSGDVELGHEPAGSSSVGQRTPYTIT